MTGYQYNKLFFVGQQMYVLLYCIALPLKNHDYRCQFDF